MKKYLKYLAIAVEILALIVTAIPLLLTFYLDARYHYEPSYDEQFPVTVDPVNKIIIEDEKVEAYLQSRHFATPATTIFSTNRFEEIFLGLAVSISEILEDNNLALVSSEKFVTITPGLRKEEVANAFARALGWNDKEKKEFMNPQKNENLPLTEGSFPPGVYAVQRGSKSLDVQDLVNERFTNIVLSRYGTTTSEIVPLNVALTVASLIQRETIGTEDMRMISGIIWNRIFSGMKLQLDATLQYTRANSKKTTVWWPEVRPQDKFIKSPYNTYIHSGLPPAPIANPSVAAIIAALNPFKTTCIFYFHDNDGDLHCSRTYEEHVALLKKFYGRGR